MLKLFRVFAALSIIAAMLAALSASAAGEPQADFANTITSMANNLTGNNHGAVPVNWQQNNIGYNQLQNVFAQNPNANLFNIHFPNGTNWEVNPESIKSFYNQYMAQAANEGFGRNPPALNFSSLPSAISSLSGNSVTIPVTNAMDAMQQQAQQMLDQINYQKYSFLNGLPDWLKKTLTLICDGFLILWDFACSEVESWFR